jgi:hypothetical protein
MDKKHDVRQRLIALLTREEMEFIEKLGLDSSFSTGTKLSKVEIISAFVDAAMTLNLSAIGVKSKEELLEKIKRNFSDTSSSPEREAKDGK